MFRGVKGVIPTSDIFIDLNQIQDLNWANPNKNRVIAAVERIYMISMGSIVTGGMPLQSHLLSTTTMNKLLLGICWMTKDLQPKQWQD